jgi:hypothetical protein
LVEVAYTGEFEPLFPTATNNPELLTVIAFRTKEEVANVLNKLNDPKYDNLGKSVEIHFN